MSEICCICLQKSVFFQSINECVFGTVKYIEKLNSCVPNELWHESLNICNDCVDKLDSAYSFVQSCLKSLEWRKEQVTLIESKDALLIKPKEESAANFTCFQCGKSFRLKRTLSIHITRIHTNAKKNKKKTSATVKSESDIGNGIKKENNQLIDACLADKGKLKTGSENVVKLDNEKENVKEDNDSNFEDYNHDNNYSSEEDAVKEKKPYKGKKRGYKSKGPFKCEFCELVFTRTHKLKHHVRAKHTFEKPFKCKLCDAKYLNRSYLSVHMRKHTNEKPYVCSTCGKSFISTNDLWRHNKIHDSIRHYACNECDRSFKTNSNLRTHQLQMHQDPGMWKFTCTVCGRRFPLNNTLVKHMRRHEGIKDFVCHLCDKRFIENGELRFHLLSHSDERNYKCNICEKAYKKSDNLSRHLKRDHDIGKRVLKKPEKKFACPMCPKMFEYNNKLQRHILTHTGEKPVQCEYCEKRFRDNYDKGIHLRKDHNIEPKALMAG